MVRRGDVKGKGPGYHPRSFAESNELSEMSIRTDFSAGNRGDPIDAAAQREHRRYCTWLRKRTARLYYGERTPVGVRQAPTNAQLAEFFERKQYTVGPDWIKKHLPRLNNADYARHLASEATYYYFGAGQTKAAESLLNIDLDCHHGVGTFDGAMGFAGWLKRRFFPDLYTERSTNGHGVHGYLAVRKGGLGARAVNARFGEFESWLEQQALAFGAEVSGWRRRACAPSSGGGMVAWSGSRAAHSPRCLAATGCWAPP
jgi:hypothetical protein